MQFQEKPKHMIDFLFPVALFCTFAVSALTVILMAAQVYRSVAETSSANDTSRTSLAYVAEKIHQQDAGSSVSTGYFYDNDALILSQDVNGETYNTYIYAYEGELKELFAKDDVISYPASGKTILKVRDFTVEQMSETLFHFSCTDENGRISDIIVGTRSSAE